MGIPKHPHSALWVKGSNRVLFIVLFPQLTPHVSSEHTLHSLHRVTKRAALSFKEKQSRTPSELFNWEIMRKCTWYRFHCKQVGYDLANVGMNGVASSSRKKMGTQQQLRKQVHSLSHARSVPHSCVAI